MQPFDFSSLLDAPRADTTTNLVDWWQARIGPGQLMALFGFNNNAARQYLQVFDVNCAQGPTLGIGDSDNAAMTLNTDLSHFLTTGQRVQVTDILGPTDNLIYYARVINASRLALYDTLAHALNTAATTGRVAITNNGDTGTLKYIPKQSFSVGASDNYSFVIPVRGSAFNAGLLLAQSTTPGFYTAPATKDFSMFGVLQHVA